MIALSYGITYIWGTVGIILITKYLPKWWGIDARAAAKEYETLLETKPPGEIALRARLQLAASDYALRAQLDNEPAVAIPIFQLPGSNALELSKSVRGAMEELAKGFPPGLEYKIAYDPKFWGLSTEWIEPISDWLNSEETLGQIAARHEIFEGNLQKALMKLSGLLEEFQAMATMYEQVEMLKGELHNRIAEEV